MSATGSSLPQTRLQASLASAASRKAPSIGQWLEFPGYQLARTVASLDPDWILIDCEHGNIDDSSMHQQVAAVASAGVSPIVRIPSIEAWMVKRALDCGAHGIMVPMIETAEQAEAIVRAAKYRSSDFPTAVRGAGVMFAHHCFPQTASGRAYLTHANRLTTVILQIESRMAVENCEVIAQVAGVDMLFIGHNDLANSMGYFAFDHAKIDEVQAAGAKVLEACRNNGKRAGYLALSAEEAAKRYKQGFDFMNCGADIVALTNWMENEMGRMKSMLQEGTKDDE